VSPVNSVVYRDGVAVFSMTGGAADVRRVHRTSGRMLRRRILVFGGETLRNANSLVSDVEKFKVYPKSRFLSRSQERFEDDG
jgi:hypothetical protein